MSLRATMIASFGAALRSGSQHWTPACIAGAVLSVAPSPRAARALLHVIDRELADLQAEEEGADVRHLRLAKARR